MDTGKLNEAIERAGMTSRDVAKAIGVDESCVCRYRKGQIRDVRVRTLKRFCKALGVKAEEIW